MRICLYEHEINFYDVVTADVLLQCFICYVVRGFCGHRTRHKGISHAYHILASEVYHNPPKIDHWGGGGGEIKKKKKEKKNFFPPLF